MNKIYILPLTVLFIIAILIASFLGVTKILFYKLTYILPFLGNIWLVLLILIIVKIIESKYNKSYFPKSKLTFLKLLILYLIFFNFGIYIIRSFLQQAILKDKAVNFINHIENKNILVYVNNKLTSNSKDIILSLKKLRTRKSERPPKRIDRVYKNRIYICITDGEEQLKFILYASLYKKSNKYSVSMYINHEIYLKGKYIMKKSFTNIGEINTNIFNDYNISYIDINNAYLKCDNHHKTINYME